VNVEPFGDDDVEITATLLSTSADSEVLEQIAAQLAAKPYIKQAYWNQSITE
jgi:putative Mg2+ transporter-C (MgtC) family protein